MKRRRVLEVVPALAVLAVSSGPAYVRGQAAAAVEISVIRQTCDGYSGPENCYMSLSGWEADYGGIDFAGNPQGNLVAADKIAVARIEGTWTNADTQPLDLSGWVTDAEHYVRIYTTSEARHDGTAGSGYRLVTTGSQPIYSSVAHFRIEGLEIHGQCDGTLVYARPGAGLAGEIHFSHNLIHGNGVDTGSGIYVYDYDGAMKAWNNTIYDVGNLGYLAGIQTSRGTVYAYNNTIVDVIAGFGIRSGGMVVAKNNLIEAPEADFYGVFHPDSNFNASADNTAPGLNSRRSQVFSFVASGSDDFHLANTDAAARNHGTDLSADAHIAVADDIDGDARSGGWDTGADEATGGTDVVPPVRFDGAPSGTLPSDTTEVTLSLSTNESATCRYATTPGVSFGAMTNIFLVTGGLTHTQHVAGLVDDQTYTYYVRCRDTAGSTNDDDYVVSFYIFSADTVPPVISGVQVLDISPYSGRITWQTDEGCTSQVEYGETDGYGTITPTTVTRVTSHSVALVGLDPSTTYHFRVRPKDVAYNETISGDYVFSTSALSNLHYVNQKHASASDSNPGTESLPWLTIQHAADVAQPGDTVIIYPGSYDRVTINRGGTAGNYVTFVGVNAPDQSLADPDALFDPDHPVQIPGNSAVNAVMRGFTIQPPYLVTEPVAYVRIENLEITDIAAGGYVGASAISMANTERIEIVGNFVHDVNPVAHGMGLVGGSQANVGNVIKGNTLYRVQGVGMSIVGQNWLVEENEVSHGLDVHTGTGVYDGSDTDALRFFGSGHVVRSNYFHDYLDEEQLGDPHIDCFQTFSVYPDSQFAYDILIEGNVCDGFGQMLMTEDQSEAGGGVDKVHHLTFRNNIFRGARATAINGSNTGHLTFVNNLVIGSHYTAVGLIGSPYMTVQNNIFYNNGDGSQLTDLDSKIGSAWDYNIHYPDFSWPPKQPEYDQHSMFGVEPGFVGPATGDYRPRCDSPAIDVGTVQHSFNYDINTVARPQGAGWDIGAYEFVPGPLMLPVALALTPLSQGVLKAGDTVEAQPSWRNDGCRGTASMTGAATARSGGTIVDGGASYGVVAIGATAGCAGESDCYSLAVGGARPANHWDVKLTETLSEPASHEWLLHVGDSFSDVPRTSSYFRFIETLYHKQVTGGCSATSYCPGNSTTRAQMSIFALVGKEGAAYSPVACGTTPMFADVVVTSPYCKWVEELARRGVVGGCSGGNYCPNNAVTRGQMAIFMLKTLDPALDPPACGTTLMFGDVPATSPYCKWIEELARRGVVSGCGGGNYCPSNPVTRGQMGVFISATFGLTLYGP
jgi:hypothetical protein